MKKKSYTNKQMAALADAFGRSLVTIQRWIRLKDDRLTSDKAKAALKNLPVGTGRER